MIHQLGHCLPAFRMLPKVPVSGEARPKWRRGIAALALFAGALLGPGPQTATATASTLSVLESRVTSDNLAGSYKRYDGQTDPVLTACATSRRAQSEPSASIDPHNPLVVMVTATDRCNHTTFAQGNGGEEGIYRSADGGRTWTASLAPGYIGDTSPAAPAGIEKYCTSPIRSESDSTLAFDMDGNAFVGFQCGNGQGPLAELVSTYANDGSQYVRTVQVSQRPRSASNDDKPNLAVDRSATASRGNIYVAWSRFDQTTSLPQITVARSTDHGQTFVQSAPLTGAKGYFSSLAVGPDGIVYLSYALGLAPVGHGFQVLVSRSTDHGQTFSPPALAVAALDGYAWETFGHSPLAVGCGDGPSACTPAFTAPATSDNANAAITADATGVHMVWDQYTPLGQEKIYFANSRDGLSWPVVGRKLDNVRVGHQFQPAITSAGGVITVVFYDSRHDPAYAPLRPVGNTASGTNSGPALDAFVAQSTDGGSTWSERRVSSRSWNPNWESYLYQRAPWQGDYIYADSIPGRAFVAWTDSRDVVSAVDPRDGGATDGFDVLAPCAWAPSGIQATSYSAPDYHDPCLSKGGLDQNIYAAYLGNGGSATLASVVRPLGLGLPDTSAP